MLTCHHLGEKRKQSTYHRVKYDVCSRGIVSTHFCGLTSLLGQCICISLKSQGRSLTNNYRKTEGSLLHQPGASRHELSASLLVDYVLGLL